MNHIPNESENIGVWLLAIGALWLLAYLGRLWQRENDPHWQQVKAAEKQNKMMEEFLKQQEMLGTQLPPLPSQYELQQRRRSRNHDHIYWITFFLGLIGIYFYFFYYLK